MVLLVVLAIINFIIYHKFVRVIYFGNMGKSIVGEIAMCFIVAAFELVIISAILDAVVGVVGIAGGIVWGIVKFVFKLIIAIIIIFAILFIISTMLPEKEDDKDEKIIENNEVQNEVENEKMIESEEIVEVEEISENESTGREQKDNGTKKPLINSFKIIVIGVLIYCLIALFSNKEKNEEKDVNDNVVEQQSIETIIEENKDYEEASLEDNEVYEESYEGGEQVDAIVNPFDFLNDVDMCWYANENQTYYFSQILYGLEEGLAINNIVSYTLVDMDKDGSTEIILELTGQYDEYYLIISYSEKIQMNIVVTKGLRDFRDLTLDGVYMGSNGAASWYYCTLNFTDPDNIAEEIIASADNGYYEIYGEAVTEDLFNQFCEKIYETDSAIWNSYTEESFVAELGISGKVVSITEEDSNVVGNLATESIYIPEKIIKDEDFIEYDRISGLYYGIGENYASINMYSSFETEFVGNIELDGEVTLWGELIQIDTNLYQIVTESEDEVLLGVYMDNGTITGNLFINGQSAGYFRMIEQFAPPQ